jgi:hypothetical protein
MSNYPVWFTPEQIAAADRAKKRAKGVAEDAAARAARIKAARLSKFRARRDEKLTACDWTQLPDAQLTEEQRAAWVAYRQALRDLPDTADDNGWVQWPEEPTV